MIETGFCVEQFIKSTDVSEFDEFDVFYIACEYEDQTETEILSLSLFDTDMDGLSNYRTILIHFTKLTIKSSNVLT